MGGESSAGMHDGKHRYGVYPRGDDVAAYGFRTDDTAVPVFTDYRSVPAVYRRISGEPFRCTLNGVGRGEVHLEIETMQGAACGEAILDARSALFVLPFDQAATRALGAPLDECVYFVTPGFRLDGASHGMSLATVDVQREALDALFAAAGIENAMPPATRPQMIPLDGPQGAALAALMRDFAEVLRNDPLRLADPALFAHVEQEAMAAAEAALSSTIPARPHDMTHAASVRLAWAAKEMLDVRARSAGEPLAIGDVCRALGANERTLRQAFLSEFGVRFGEMARSFRLQAVHEEILAGHAADSVTAIALRHGFWHLGRFAGHYREMFGRAPSEAHRIACAGRAGAAADARRT